MHSQRLITSLVRSAYRRHGYRQLEVVDCRIERGTVILEGELPTEHLKQVAETIAASVPQVGRIVNQIEVGHRESPCNCES
ncbi:BON domain-containing protein [Aeoliella sp.]|uniref:BON domain-containing protein n=1 Tax=Aeoliella sp. TaxID=2795800 RepID=UPI003CCBF1C5